jgi:hypothetical protein
MIEQATGINLWRGWGRLELAQLRGESYKLPKVKKLYSGLVVTLSKQEYPDLSAFSDKEVVWRASKPYHAGLIVASKDPFRVQKLVENYIGRFSADFTAKRRDTHRIHGLTFTVTHLHDS